MSQAAKPALTSAPRILVVGPSWVGDMVMAQSLFLTLKQRWPDSHIGVVAPGWSQPILERMEEVSEVFGLDVGHGELVGRLGASWRISCGDALIAPLFCLARGSRRWFPSLRVFRSVRALPVSSVTACLMIAGASIKPYWTRP